VSMCITGLLEMISIPVITSGIDSGGLGFLPHWNTSGSMSSSQEHWWK
jgi:hypothetical protein